MRAVSSVSSVRSAASASASIADVGQHGAGEDGAADRGERILRPREDRRRRRAAHALQRHQHLGHDVAALMQRAADAVLVVVQPVEPRLGRRDLVPPWPACRWPVAIRSALRRRAVLLERRRSRRAAPPGGAAETSIERRMASSSASRACLRASAARLGAVGGLLRPRPRRPCGSRSRSRAGQPRSEEKRTRDMPPDRHPVTLCQTKA